MAPRFGSSPPHPGISNGNASHGSIEFENADLKTQSD